MAVEDLMRLTFSVGAEDALAWVERRTACWNRHDAAALAADHAVDGTVHSALAGVVRGRVSIEALYARLFVAFPDLQFRTDRPFVEADRMALPWTITGTQHGPFLGMAPTHHRLRFAGVSIYEFADDQIAYERRVVDFTGVLAEAADPERSAPIANVVV